MSLLTSFPEIELFFKSDSFTQQELLSFTLDIEKTYKDEYVRKAAATLIKLKILQYEIEPDVSFEKANIIEKHNSLHSVLRDGRRQDPLLKHLRTCSITNISINLDWRLSRLKTLLAQKGIEKNENEKLTNEEFFIVKEMFQARLKALERIEKEKHPTKIINNKNKEKSLSPRKDVYSKIEAVGLGKVIYIRKK